MEYRYLGPTGIKVSVISLGNWVNSNSNQNLQPTIKCVKTAWDLGINFFDTAQMYGYGEAERQLGVALKALNVPRSEYVLTTKLYRGSPDPTKPNRVCLTRKKIIEGIHTSLKNLDHTYVDVVYAHRMDHQTPMEQICRAFDWVVRKGYAHYWGTSQWEAQQIVQAFSVCGRLGLIKPVVQQPQYNIYERKKVEITYKRLFEKTKMGCTVWSPLYGGLLTGKYNKEIPQNNRFAQHKYMMQRFQKVFSESIRQQSIKKLNKLQQIAQQLQCTMGQLAMAWVIYNKNVSSAITGATKPQQLIETVKAVEVLKRYTPEIDKRIQEIFKTAPSEKKPFSILTSSRCI